MLHINLYIKMIKSNRVKLLIFFLLSLVLSQSCLDLSSCNKDLKGKYYCNREEGSINYLELKQNGKYYHYYKNGKVELFNEGYWQKSKDGYCVIELEGWKNFNEKGVNYKDFIESILFVNGNYLDVSPDGESSSSFKRE
ncbi:hypothetical protein ACG2LH_16565 [Zhouia sp. PK063]|uniref:hypothetical protein n=1 Tax=Zhouia sp. PK063 TaxID=3373602 RepID=UPI00378B1241